MCSAQQWLKLCRTSSHGSLMDLSDLHALADDASRLILVSARPCWYFLSPLWATPFNSQHRHWQPSAHPALSGRPQLASPRTAEQIVNVLRVRCCFFSPSLNCSFAFSSYHRTSRRCYYDPIVASGSRSAHVSIIGHRILLRLQKHRKSSLVGTFKRNRVTHDPGRRHQTR